MVKQRNLAMLDRNLAKLYLVYLEWEPCDVILDKNHILSYLACCLSCHHAYVYFRFIHVMLLLPVFRLKVARTYQSL